jgi:hypothetical protein
MTPERESVIDELRRELARVRAALVESMDWGWSVYIPPDEVIARCQAALGITAAIEEFCSGGAVSSRDRRTRHVTTRPQAA